MRAGVRLLAAAALPVPLSPVTGGFSGAPVHKAPGQSVASRPAAAAGSSLLLGHLGPAAALGS